jgi:MFS family permease
LCWASANKGLGAWVTDYQRNTVFGYFGTCPFVGGIIGTAFAVYLQTQYGWRFVHFVPSIFCVSYLEQSALNVYFE